jgi:hypothetical protein
MAVAGAIAATSAANVMKQPPLYMPPWRSKIAEGELDDLTQYLTSLLPKGEKQEF